MLSQRTGLAALLLTTVLGGGTLVMTEASAKGRCTAGQILKVSSGTCISRAVAVQQGIVGGKRKASQESTRHDRASRHAAAVAAKAAAGDEGAEQETTSVARTEPQAPSQPAPSARSRVASATPANGTVMASAAASGVRIEMVKTEPRPTPAILTPTWPYGELAAFPRRVSP